MDDREAYIQREIEHTRESMTEKLAMIQARVEETIEDTQSTVIDVINSILKQVNRVQDVIEHMTSMVDATVTQVQDMTQKSVADGKPAIEIIAEMSLRPWVMMGTVILAGYILGSSNRSSSTDRRAPGASVSNPGPDASPAYNPTGNTFIIPTTESVRHIASPSSVHLPDPAGHP